MHLKGQQNLPLPNNRLTQNVMKMRFKTSKMVKLMKRITKKCTSLFTICSEYHPADWQRQRTQHIGETAHKIFTDHAEYRKVLGSVIFSWSSICLGSFALYIKFLGLPLEAAGYLMRNLFKRILAPQSYILYETPALNTKGRMRP